jgi:hypothetical protein
VRRRRRLGSDTGPCHGQLRGCPCLEPGGGRALVWGPISESAQGSPVREGGAPPVPWAASWLPVSGTRWRAALVWGPISESAQRSLVREGGAPSVPWATSWLPVSGNRMLVDSAIDAKQGPRMRGDDKASPYWDRTDSDPCTPNRPPPRPCQPVPWATSVARVWNQVEGGACVGADLRIGPKKPHPGGRCSSGAMGNFVVARVREPDARRFGNRRQTRPALARRRQSVALLGPHGLWSAHPKPGCPPTASPASVAPAKPHTPRMRKPPAPEERPAAR